MRLLSLAILISTFVIFILNQSFAESTDTESNDKATKSNEHLQILTESCYKNWEALNWKIGQANTLAKNNPAFREGIHRVCQAKAELFFEGYEISPFIEADSQNEIFPIVFQSSVADIKAQIRSHLPKLKLI